MFPLPIYLWAIVLVALIGITASICLMLWRDALTVGLDRGAAGRITALRTAATVATAVESAR